MSSNLIVGSNEEQIRMSDTRYQILDVGRTITNIQYLTSDRISNRGYRKKYE
ncbi:MAG: hypothetical protein ACRD63_17440 [Pyrinomonadaceae bacterium]